MKRYDEINNHVEGRYVNALKVAWMILGFGYVSRQKVVVRLDVHLDVHHTVYYRKGIEQRAAENDRPRTKITEWFESNKIHETARRLLYSDYAMYFT